MRGTETAAVPGAGGEAGGRVPPEIAAEAAVWIARLHGPSRSAQMEGEFRVWQARSAVHRLAFERCTDTWQEVAGVSLRTYARAAGISPHVAAPGAGRLWGRPWALALAGLLVAGVLVLGLGRWRDADTYDTGVGELRTLVLKDGTRASLNTSTRLRVAYGEAQRTVVVERGEALFEVAKNPSRPFVVRAAGSEVVATGTAFVVRLMPASAGARDVLDVTLVEGQVIVREAASPVAVGAARGVPAAPVVMSPGQRIRVSGAVGGTTMPSKLAADRLDRRHMDQLLAWKRGEVVFEDVPLADALAEMNRYSLVPIGLADAAALGGLRLSGVFRAGDSANFASAVAQVHGLKVLQAAGRIELAAR